LLGGVALLLAAAASPQAHADVITGLATDFALLYEGSGGHQLQITNDNVTGNIGIGGTGTYSDSGNGSITGVVEFSAAQIGAFPGTQFTNTSTAIYTPALAQGVNPLYSQSLVTNALNQVNTLNTTLATATPTGSVTINPTVLNTQTINLSTYSTTPNTTIVLTTTFTSLTNNQTLIINGTGCAGCSVVFNISTGASFNGTITLAGGLTPDQVLFNAVGSGLTFQWSANMNLQAADFLDPLGTLTVDNVNITGRIFGGDSTNEEFVSGANIVAPPSAVPLPAALPLLATGLCGLGLLWRRRRRPGVARSPNQGRLASALAS
jgi:hypothetical protein